MEWNIQALRDHIHDRMNGDREGIGLITSMDGCTMVLRYHLLTAENAQNLIEADDVTGLRVPLRGMFGTTDQRNEYELAKLVCQANIVAAIYTARSLCDVLAQLINKLLLPDKLEAAKCDIHKVSQKLCNSVLKESLTSLLDSECFLYVSAFANVSKHRNMVVFYGSINCQARRAGAKFGSFTYNKREYPERWSRDVLKLVLEVESKIIDVGGVLNSSCLHAAT